MFYCGLSLDISHQYPLMKALLEFYSNDIESKMLIEHGQMIRGDIVNKSEIRQALHTLLRSFSSLSPMYKEVSTERERILHFASLIRNGEWCGCCGDQITDVINIGIGGSDMGPRMVYHALKESNLKIRLHCLSTVDGHLLSRILDMCNPFSTLVVVSSKSFKTQETLVNARAVDQWLAEAGITGSKRTHHIVVVSANPSAADVMHLPKANQFNFWDWVGGRFSVWGAVGLPLAIALGREVFLELLHGAEEMDKHSIEAPIEKNLPATLALLAYWNIRKLGIKSHCVLPYDERLRVMVPWLQQLEMESLGKKPQDSDQLTGQLVWGANGNEGQHSFYQWLREGTDKSSIDLILCEKANHRYPEHHRVLLANAKAQAEALVTRPNPEEFYNALTVITIDELTPRRLSALMAMYEHKTTMLGSLLGINPFDQPGVELGKKLSLRVEQGEDPHEALSKIMSASD